MSGRPGGAADPKGPGVSVVIPAFNAGRFLPETLRSVLEQTYSDWECVVVDDGSTDDTAAVVQAAAQRDPRIRYRFQRNRFCAGARNAGLGLASGRYVQFLDADDLLLKDKLEAQVAFLDAHPEIDVSYSGYRPFQSETGELLDPFWPETLGPDPLEDFLFRWERGLCIPIHAGLFRRVLWPSAAVFDERLRAKEDWVMWIGLALEGRRFHFLDRDLVRYRLHPTNTYTEAGMGLTFLYAAAIVTEKLPDALRGRFLDASFRHASWRFREELSALAAAPFPSGEAAFLRQEVERLAANLAALQEPKRSRTEARTGRPALAACTIISRNYLAHARALARSFLQNEPGGRFYLLVVDGLPEGAAAGDGVRVLHASELGLPYLRELIFKYEILELCTALKPALLDHLFRTFGEDRLVYLDPDILIFRPLAELPPLLEEWDIVVTPHFLSPIPLDGRRPTELPLIATGIYNLGFLAVRRSDVTASFLRWWKERLRDGCHARPSLGEFVDQKWVDLAPIFFPTTHILRDETYNVAYWNLHTRRISREGDGWTVNGRPITFFHFSGVDLKTRRFRTSYQDRTEARPGTPIAELLNLYGDLLEENGLSTCLSWEYPFSRFDNGVAYSTVFRDLYASLDPRRKEEFGDILRTRGPDSFFEWALTPDPRTADLNPLLMYLYRLRRDVSAAYPDVLGKDREGFLTWARTSGAREMGYDPAEIRIGGPAAG